jgi:hypothetical protein
MRVNDLKNGVSKVLLLKTFDQRKVITEFVTTRSGKPRHFLLLHEFDLSESPIVTVATYVKMSVAFEAGHFGLGMKRIPLRMARHIVRSMDSALPAIGEIYADPSFPVFLDTVGTGHPFERVASTTPHVMVAANQNQRVYVFN